MPGGDDDDDIEDMSDEEQEFGKAYDSKGQGSKGVNSKPLPCAEKFIALYDDAKHRNLRQEHIYAKCIDKECTFKPDLITQKSKISQSTIKEVQKQVRDKS